MPSKARLLLCGTLVQSEALTAKGAKKCRKGREGTGEKYGGSLVRNFLNFETDRAHQFEPVTLRDYSVA